MTVLSRLYFQVSPNPLIRVYSLNFARANSTPLRLPLQAPAPPWHMHPAGLRPEHTAGAWDQAHGKQPLGTACFCPPHRHDSRLLSHMSHGHSCDSFLGYTSPSCLDEVPDMVAPCFGLKCVTPTLIWWSPDLQDLRMWPYLEIGSLQM